MDIFIDRPVGHDGRVENLVAAFEQEFARRPDGIAEAPGRVNLIGEHVDYNDGLVLPFAIDRSVMVAWARRDDDAVWAYSNDADERSRFNLGNITRAAPEKWPNYVRGVVGVFADTGQTIGGADLAISGNVPQGAGLSSSAAVEVAVAGALRDAFDLSINDIELARICQRAENEFVGVQCGIMDQFASTLSQGGHALLIDCRSLTSEVVPMRLSDAALSIVIVNSAVPRELVGSAYNDRRSECELAVSELRLRLERPGLASVRDVTAADLERVEVDSMPMRRARHVAGEIGRVVAAVDALRRGDFEAVGRLMIESHLSLREDYEVSSTELDLLVGLATAQEYVLGARLTGAGFGGCTVNLVRTDSVETFGRDVIASYRQRTGLPAVMYVTSPQEGLRTWRV